MCHCLSNAHHAVTFLFLTSNHKADESGFNQDIKYDFALSKCVQPWKKLGQLLHLIAFSEGLKEDNNKMKDILTLISSVMNQKQQTTSGGYINLLHDKVTAFALILGYSLIQ